MHAHILNERQTWRHLTPAAGEAYAKLATRVSLSSRRRIFSRLFRRSEPSTFQRCLAVHMHNAARHGALE